MRFRPLGESGIEASVVGLGTWAMGGWFWGGSDEAAAVEAVRGALDAGINLIDTAPAYGLGRSETLVGKALEGRRDEAVIATKCGLVWHVAKGEYFFDEYDQAIHRYLGPESVRYEVEQSLKRLRTDYLDLYQTHWQDATTPIEDTMAVLLKLRDEGKIRAIGVSNVTVDHLERYPAAGGIVSVQEKFNLLDREHAAETIAWAHIHSLAVLAYSPLATGLLTGKIGPERRFEGDDQRLNNPRFSAENLRKVASLLAEFEPLARRRGVSIGQLVIGWTAAQMGVTHVLCGARNAAQARANAAAGDLELAGEELAAMERAIAEHRPGIV